MKMSDEIINQARIGIYPYGKEAEPILRHVNLLANQYRITALASPRGWGLTEKKIDLHNGTILKVKNNPRDISDEIDVLLIPDFNAAENIEIQFVDRILEGIEEIHTVLCAKNFSKESLKKIENHPCIISGSCSFIYLNRYYTQKEEDFSTREELNGLENIEVPVIAISGIMENTDKFEISLIIRELLIKSGYKVSQIGSRSYCELFDFISFPQFMLNPQIDEIKKVYLLNDFLKQIINKEKPDVLIITIPGGIQSFSDEFPEKMGILPFLAFKAIQPDYMILCTLYGEYQLDYFKEISRFCYYTLGCPVDCFHMSNLVVDIVDSKHDKKLSTYAVFRDLVTKAVYKIICWKPQIPVVNLMEENDKDKVYKYILAKLAEGDEVVIV